MFDSHFHLVQCWKEDKNCTFYSGITCAHEKEEFLLQEKLASQLIEKGLDIKLAFGLHPWNIDFSNADFLEGLLKDNRIDYIGETGFDFYTKELKDTKEEQEKAFNICLDFSLQYNKPLVIHNRKALEKIYEYSKGLSKVPHVIFHAFPFGSREAFEILRKGVNAYFSFGVQALKGSKKALDCIQNLPQERLRCETDAPYQCGTELILEISRILEYNRKN